MITRTIVEKMQDFVREPVPNGYGKWGTLNGEQRKLIRELCKSWIILDDATNRQTQEIEKLKKENELLKASIKAEEKISKLLPNDTEFIIVRREDYDRLFGSDK